jgi:hypothetical protein
VGAGSRGGREDEESEDGRRNISGGVDAKYHPLSSSLPSSSSPSAWLHSLYPSLLWRRHSAHPFRIWPLYWQSSSVARVLILAALQRG